jgi:hypothetical protein
MSDIDLHVKIELQPHVEAIDGTLEMDPKTYELRFTPTKVTYGKPTVNIQFLETLSNPPSEVGIPYDTQDKTLDHIPTMNELMELCKNEN